jgi:hypothetical protein
VRHTGTGEVGLLTAAHTFPDGVGSEVERRRWPRLGRLSPLVHLGSISHHVVPRPGVADWDVAIIKPRRGLIPPARTFIGCRPRLDQEETVFAHGARSGFITDAIVVKAAMTSHGNQRHIWKNCWLVTPGGVLRPGDSGTAVFTAADQALLGLYVGSGRTPLGRATHHYVQDAFSIQQQVLAPWGLDYC